MCAVLIPGAREVDPDTPSAVGTAAPGFRDHAAPRPLPPPTKRPPSRPRTSRARSSAHAVSFDRQMAYSGSAALLAGPLFVPAHALRERPQRDAAARAERMQRSHAPAVCAHHIGARLALV